MKTVRHCTAYFVLNGTDPSGTTEFQDDAGRWCCLGEATQVELRVDRPEAKVPVWEQVSEQVLDEYRDAGRPWGKAKTD